MTSVSLALRVLVGTFYSFEFSVRTLHMINDGTQDQSLQGTYL